MDAKELLEKERIDSAQLQKLLEARKRGECDFVLVDIREPYEYEEAHIVGVDLLRPTTRFRDWADELVELSTQKPVVLTCRTANRTGQVYAILQRMGAKRVIDHLGGILSWQGEVEGGAYGGD